MLIYIYIYIYSHTHIRTHTHTYIYIYIYGVIVLRSAVCRPSSSYAKMHSQLWYLCKKKKKVLELKAFLMYLANVLEIEVLSLYISATVLTIS